MRLALDSVTRCAAAWHRERQGNVTERARAAAIAAPLRRAQFLAGRWLAANMLAQHLGGSAVDWLLTCVRGEAPRIAHGPGTAFERPFVSIAHRGDVVACALADAPVGVDIEIEGRLRGAAADHAPFVLSPGEAPEFASTPAADRAAFVLARWTLKEAWAKQAGRGLALGEMRDLTAHALPDGGNARLWTAQPLVVALCCDTPHDWPLPQGLGFERASPQHWQVSPLRRP